MAARETITVSLTLELRSCIEGPFAFGHHDQTSEVVRAGLRRPIEAAAAQGARGPDRPARGVSDRD